MPDRPAQPHMPSPPPHRLRFWQRTYLATLTLFLVCLLGGVFGVTAVSRNLSFDARCEEFLGRHHMIVQSMAEDIAAVAANRPAALPDLYTYYGRRYAGEGTRLAVWLDGTAVYSGQPNLSARPEITGLEPGQRSWQVRVLNGRHIIFATTRLAESLSGYVVSGCADIESFYTDWKRMDLLVTGLAGSVCAAFALGLYVVLKQMYRPIRRLTDTARRLAGGDFTARALPCRADELGDLARTLNDMAARVENQLTELAAQAEAKQQLVDNLSHEMRTPLTAIGGYAEYIQCAELSPSELMEATDTIRFESNRLLNLSNQLVKLSVLAHEPADYSLLSPAELVNRALSAVAPKGAARGVNVLAGPLPAVLPPIRGNADLLESLLVNLADNGIKACGAEGRVTISARAGADGGCVFTVADTGRGMDAAALAHIGQPFYRVDKARSRAEGGAGLGVALCTAIANAHGATLHYRSAPGKGTVAEVTLPPADAPSVPLS